MIAFNLYQSSIFIQNANFTWSIFSSICTFVTSDNVNIIWWPDPRKLKNEKEIHIGDLI